MWYQITTALANEMNFYSGDLGSGEVNSTLDTAANDDQLTAQLIFWKNNPHHAPSDNIFLRCQKEKRAHKRRPSLLRQDPAPPGKTQLSWGGREGGRDFFLFPAGALSELKAFYFREHCLKSLEHISTLFWSSHLLSQNQFLINWWLTFLQVV